MTWGTGWFDPAAKVRHNQGESWMTMLRGELAAQVEWNRGDAVWYRGEVNEVWRQGG